jgi:DNA-directed RNA polymerase subunit RPC12/RpoP
MDTPNNYLNALKSKPLRDVKIEPTERKQAFLNQKGKCAKCGRELKPYLHQYVRDPQTKKMIALCSDCSMPSKYFQRD